MAKFIDYYKILGVDRSVSQADLKKAYRDRSKRFHPDLHPDDPKAKAKFQLLNEAYDVLKDPDKRARYDQYGEHWNQMGGAGGASGGNYGGFGGFGAGGGNGFEGFDFGSMGSGAGGFSDFFSELFGGMRGSRRASTSRTRKVADTQASVTIDMFQAALGGPVIIQTPSGEKLRLNLKPGTQPGAKMRLRGKGSGINPATGEATDLIITLNVSIPTALTEAQKSLLAQAQHA